MKPVNVSRKISTRFAAAAWVVPAVLSAALLGGCGALPFPSKFTATIYDFGPGALAADSAAGSVTTAPTVLPPLMVPEIGARGHLDSTQQLYRLGYDDANALRMYTHSRWSEPPAQLLHKRLVQQLMLHRMVFEGSKIAALEQCSSGSSAEAGARTGAGQTPELHLSLEEFSQYFPQEASDTSFALVRVHATLVQPQAGGGCAIINQRMFTVQRPAPTPNAAGGVKALEEASDALIMELTRWVNQS
ncbi:MAG: PqiC family protein [Burkholderiaceae bacterium]|jgi:cholesterol transport system auxiliary component|nr:PqiC family protein [Burkholderiaceae bacterium]